MNDTNDDAKLPDMVVSLVEAAKKAGAAAAVRGRLASVSVRLSKVEETEFRPQGVGQARPCDGQGFAG